MVTMRALSSPSSIRRAAFGRPALTTANVETAIIGERFRAGDSTGALALDFGVLEAAIEEALRFEAQLPRAA